MEKQNPRINLQIHSAPIVPKKSERSRLFNDPIFGFLNLVLNTLLSYPVGRRGRHSRIASKATTKAPMTKAKKAFLEALICAAGDGKLTDDEADELAARYQDLELTEEDIKAVRVQAYCVALRAAQNDGRVTAEEERELNRLEKFLRIPKSDIANPKRQLARFRLLTELKSGNLPTVSVPNIVLQKNEIAHWCEPGALLEERVVGRNYGGGSSGMSFRIMKGVSYRIGGFSGSSVSEKAVVPVSNGFFVITNKRFIFCGDKKSFNVKLEKILAVNLYTDGLRLSADKGNPKTIGFAETGNVDIVGVVLSHVINNATG